MGLFAELRRRNVFKVAAAYAIVAWLLAQVAATIAPALNLPSWSVTFVVFVLLLGFPLALVLAWAFEVTPDGIKRTKHVPLTQSIGHITGQKLNYVVTALLAIAVGFLALDAYVLDPRDDAPGPVNAAVPEGSQAAAEAAQPLPNSIAVIPFDNLSSETEDEYFAAGIHEEILNQLTRLTSLNPISRTTMQLYANSTKSVRDIGRELNVKTIMEGSVRRAGERVLVTVQLIDAETDLHLWSQTYERELTDVFAIQADVATNVARALEVELSTAERRRLAREAPTASSRAYELYLAAQGLTLSTPAYEGHLQALERIDEALAIDPEFVEAWVQKASSHAILSGVAEDGQAELAASVNAALRAIAIDPTHAGARAALSFALGQQGEWARARAEFDRALALGALPAQNPQYAVLQMAVGDFVGARETLEANVAVDPMNHIAAGFLLGVYEVLGETEARRAGYERGEQLFGGWFGDSIELLLRIGEGDEEFLKSMDTAGIEDAFAPLIEVAKRHAGSPALALEALRDAIADREASAVGYVFAAALASHYGDAPFAAELLSRGTQLQQNAILYAWQPLFRDVRRGPAFAATIGELGLPDYWREFGWPDFCRPSGENGFECE